MRTVLLDLGADATKELAGVAECFCVFRVAAFAKPPQKVELAL
jgi:hypothetical protein